MSKVMLEDSNRLDQVSKPSVTVDKTVSHREHVLPAIGMCRGP